MFKQNSILVYGSRGVYKLIEIKNMDFDGTARDYYILEPFYSSNSTVFVPLENSELMGKLRNPLSAEELDFVLSSEKSESIAWIDNDNMRRQKFKDIIAAGNINLNVSLIKLICQRKTIFEAEGKKLRQSDERLLNEAVKPIVEELKFVLEKTDSEAENYIYSFCK